MSTLYIANTTKQNHIFLWRFPEESVPRRQDIRVGAQVAINNLSPEQVKMIVKQHLPYGLKGVEELPRNKEYVGLCYSIDKPVNLDSLFSAFEHNDNKLNEAAEERRETTAAAIAENLQQQLGNQGAQVARTEVEVVEETQGNPTVASGYETVAEGVAPRHGGKKRAK